MQVLLQAGAAKDATTCDGQGLVLLGFGHLCRTPLHVAASRGDMAILEGRKTEALCLEPHGHYLCVQKLLDAGAAKVGLHSIVQPSMLTWHAWMRF